MRFALCTDAGCAEAHVAEQTVMQSSVDQLVRMIEEDAAAQGMLLGPYERGRLRDQVFDSRRALLAAAD